MSIYYRLDESDYKFKEKSIGDIMLDFSEMLYKETGLKLDIYAGPLEEELKKLNKNFEILNEEVLWKNLTECEKVNIFIKYLSEIGGINGDLIIIDPYIFPKKYDGQYEFLLKNILKNSKFKTLKIITSKSKFNKSLYKKVNCALNKKIQIKFSDEFHDRFWIANENKGFLVGSSLNGVGRRISSINYLEDCDVSDLMKEIKKLGFI